MADNPVFNPDNILGDGIYDLSRGKLVALAAEVCAIAFKERGANGYRGGIRPDNISIDESGAVAIGPAENPNKDECTKAELEFISPELFWSGKSSSQSDVYSVGLLLYAGIKGKLPFVKSGSDTDLAEAFRKRMNGDKIAAPAGVGKKLGDIIEQATAFSASDRFENTLQLATELKALLVKPDTDSVSKAAEDAFGKPESELSDVERMMLGIMTDAAISDDLAEVPVEEPDDEDIEVEIEELPPEPEEEEVESIEVEIEELPPEPEEEEVESIEVEIEELPAASEPAEVPEAEVPEIIIPEAEETKVEEEPEEKPIEVPAFVNTPAKKKAPAHQAKKKRPKTYIVIIALCVVLAIAALIYNSVSDKNDAGVKQTLPPITYITPEPTETPEPVETDEPEETAKPEETPEPTEKVSTYQIFTENVSWDEAEQKCKDLGGHLVAINDEEEYNKICELLGTVSAKYVWIGCYRSSAGVMTWTNGEEIDYYNWAYREPSYKDSYDGTAEDYIMLARQSDGSWKYNDSRMDPMADYARYYSGNIAYICEIVE